MNTNNNQWSFTLCGRNGSCCPVVTQTADDEYTIVDDHGGTVKLTTEQVRLLQHVIDHTQGE